MFLFGDTFFVLDNILRVKENIFQRISKLIMTIIDDNVRVQKLQ